MFKQLDQYIQALDTGTIPESRFAVLNELVNYIQRKFNENQPVKLNFICTHNSRRSQLAQVWATILAAYFDVPIEAYSGGTEATAFNIRAVRALETAGLRCEDSGDRRQASGEENPVYQLFFAENNSPVIAFSKRYYHPDNPDTGFAAIMTCSDADENCPFIPGAEKRIPLRYDDPKAFDNTPEETRKYEERSKQIATELRYVFSKIKQS